MNFYFMSLLHFSRNTTNFISIILLKYQSKKIRQQTIENNYKKYRNYKKTIEYKKSTKPI